MALLTRMPSPLWNRVLPLKGKGGFRKGSRHSTATNDSEEIRQAEPGRSQVSPQPIPS